MTRAGEADDAVEERHVVHQQMWAAWTTLPRVATDSNSTGPVTG